MSPLVTKVRRDVSPKKSLAFNAIESENLSIDPFCQEI